MPSPRNGFEADTVLNDMDGFRLTEADEKIAAAHGTQLAARFRIDAPLRGQVFAPYPRVAPMGFHFANPVSGREPPLRLTWSDGHREEN